MNSLALVLNDDVESNVVSLRDKDFVDFYEAFIDGQRSKSTSLAYKTDLEQFFQFTFKRESQFVTLNMMSSLTSLHAMQYHNAIKKEFKNDTVKRKINAVRSFLVALSVDNKDINKSIFGNVKLDNGNNDREGYGNIDWDEAFLFIEYAHIEQMEGDQMAMLLKLACISSIRLQALLTLTWDNFRVKNEKGVLVNYIDVVDKMTRHQTPVSVNFYNELKEKLGCTKKLFPNLHPHKIGHFLKEILVYFEVDEKRNIRFHSFKKCGVNRVLDKTGDLTKAQVQGKHKSIVTTNNSYIALKDDLTLRPSFTLDQDIDIVKEIKAKDLSCDDLLEAIGKLDDSAKYQLLRIINKG